MEDTPLPITLVHPRWWLYGPPIYQSNWGAFLSLEPVPSPIQAIEPSVIAQLAELRGQLNSQER